MHAITHREHYALLHIGATRLALTQHEVRTLEAGADVGGEGGVRFVATSGRRWPVLAIDDELRPVALNAAPRRICAMLALRAGLFGLLCDEVEVLPQAHTTLHALPASMASAQSAVLGVLAFERGIAVMSTAARLAELLRVEAHRATRDAALAAPVNA